MEGVKKSVSCVELFEKFNTLPVASECLFTLLYYTVNNIETLQSNSETHCLTPGHKHYLELIHADPTNYQQILY
jgi:hypothetical protein